MWPRRASTASSGASSGTKDSDLKALAAGLAEQGVRWSGDGIHRAVLEARVAGVRTQCQVFLAQAHSNRAPRGRKRDFADAEPLVKRPVAGEFILICAGAGTAWRTLTRSK